MSLNNTLSIWPIIHTISTIAIGITGIIFANIKLNEKYPAIKKCKFKNIDIFRNYIVKYISELNIDNSNGSKLQLLKEDNYDLIYEDNKEYPFLRIEPNYINSGLKIYMRCYPLKFFDICFKDKKTKYELEILKEEYSAFCDNNTWKQKEYEGFKCYTLLKLKDSVKVFEDFFNKYGQEYFDYCSKTHANTRL